MYLKPITSWLLTTGFIGAVGGLSPVKDAIIGLDCFCTCGPWNTVYLFIYSIISITDIISDSYNIYIFPGPWMVYLWDNVIKCRSLSDLVWKPRHQVGLVVTLSFLGIVS